MLYGYERIGQKIVSVYRTPRKDGKQHPVTGKTYHENKPDYCFYRNLNLSCNAGVVNITLHEPIIEGTEWQGAAIDENLPVTIFVDGQEVGTVDLVDGQGEFDFNATEPGTYVIEAQAELTAPDRIEVTVDA